MKNPFVCSSDWLEESSLEESITFLRSLARVHAQQAGPYATRLQEILEASAWGQLVDFPIDYGSGSVIDLYHCR